MDIKVKDKRQRLAQQVNTYSWRNIDAVQARLPDIDSVNRYFNRMFKKFGYKNKALIDPAYRRGSK